VAEENTSLSFEELAIANRLRCEQIYHPVDDWSLTDWGCAAAGEMGEACNIIKKIRRRNGKIDHNHRDLLEELGKELADTVIYLDLIAQRAGLNLGDEVRKKFNEVSIVKGSVIRL